MRNRPRRILRGLRLCALGTAILVSGCSDDTPTRVSDDPVTPVTNGEDVTPPQRIAAPVLDYPVVGGSATLTWLAPRDDDDHDRVASYDIRYSYSFPLNWELSGRVTDAPAPGDPGTPQSYAFPSPTRGRDLYAAIRSIDGADNVSPVSSIAHVRIVGHTLRATCVVATTGVPVEGLEVLVTSQHAYPQVSDAAGSFTQEDLTAGSVNVAIRFGSSGTPYLDINHLFELSRDVDLIYKMIPFEETDLGVFDSMFSLFKAAAGLEGGRTVFKKWKSVPVPLYIPPLVNSKGLDYHAICISAADRWEELTGIDLWRFVDAPPDTGVTFAFKTRTEMNGQLGITFHDQDSGGFPLRDRVDIIDEFGSFAALHTTMLHELGHTIRLAHLPAGYLMFALLPLPPDPTTDEVKVVQLYSSLPNSLDISIYDDTDPRTPTR